MDVGNIQADVTLIMAHLRRNEVAKALTAVQNLGEEAAERSGHLQHEGRRADGQQRTRPAPAAGLRARP